MIEQLVDRFFAWLRTDEVVSRIRTAVPMLIGYGLTYLATRWGWVIPDDVALWVYGLVGAGVTTVYYWLVRKLENLRSRFGWLLGYPKAPTYNLAAK